MRRISILLAFVLVLSAFSISFASTDSTIENIYNEDESEMVEIEGVSYTYEYSLSKDGNRVVTITNGDTREVETLEYLESQEAVLYNNESLIDVDGFLTGETVTSNQSEINGNSSYKYVGPFSKKITWKEAVGAAVLAGMIAVVVGISAAKVLAKIGPTVLKNIAKKPNYGTVKGKIYVSKAGKVTTYKYIWSFTPKGGSKYGNYTTYITVN